MYMGGVIFLHNLLSVCLCIKCQKLLNIPVLFITCLVHRICGLSM